MTQSRMLAPQIELLLGVVKLALLSRTCPISQSPPDSSVLSVGQEPRGDHVRLQIQSDNKTTQQLTRQTYYA